MTSDLVPEFGSLIRDVLQVIGSSCVNILEVLFSSSAAICNPRVSPSYSPHVLDVGRMFSLYFVTAKVCNNSRDHV